MINIGKIYQLTKPRIVETIVFDENFIVIAYISYGSTFIPIECLGEYPAKDYVKYLAAPAPNGKIYKLKILTSDGKVGYSAFWDDEIKMVENTNK